jgi:hypothetical protein
MSESSAAYTEVLSVHTVAVADVLDERLTEFEGESLS